MPKTPPSHHHQLHLHQPHHTDAPFMSHQSTPQIHPKRTPGTMALDTPSQLGNTETSVNTAATSVAHGLMDLLRSVLDASVSLPKQLLNAYIYDFLIKNTLPQTARLFVCEAEVPSIPYDPAHLPSKTLPLMALTPRQQANQLLEEHHLPRLALSIDAPQGFLYEWWQVFWDVHQAKNDRSSSSSMASHYYHMLLAKQRQQQEALGMEHGQYPPQMGQPQFSPQFPMDAQGPGQGQAPMMMGPQGPMNLQRQFSDARQQQRLMMSMMMKQQQHQQHPQAQNQDLNFTNNMNRAAMNVANGMQMPMGGNGSQMQMGMNMGMSMPQQQVLMPQQQGVIPQHLQQQQQQQLQQHSPHQTPQQHVQSQMHSLRQQAVSAHQQPKQGQQLPQQPGQQQAAAAAVAAAAAAASQPQSHDDNMGNGKGKQTRPIRPQLRSAASGMQHQFAPHGGMSPMNYSGQMIRQGQNGANNGLDQNQGNQQNRNTSALQDYQMQLMLLEKQNKKRLDIARNSSAGDLNSMPQMQQVQDGNVMQPSIQNAPSKVSPAPSPVLNNKNLPSFAKGKRAQPAKKNTKAGSVSGGANVRSNMAGGVKRENATPLTPAADADFSNKKRKSSTSNSPAKNSKGGPKKEEEKKVKPDDTSDAPIIEEIDLDKKPEDDDKFQSSAYFHGTLSGNDKLVLGSAAGSDPNFFNSAVASGMDDVDFEFNNFLDSADAGLNDSITGFNWGNPIEGGD